jgi:hypothetical protein
MPLKCVNELDNSTQFLPYLPKMCMGSYLRFVIAPVFQLPLEEDCTVRAKVHTPDLKVVFNNECNHRMLEELLGDEATLVISPWIERDRITNRSLVGNALVSAAKAQ